jgi:selenocysteine lyase/cysteine desulfurase
VRFVGDEVVRRRTFLTAGAAAAVGAGPLLLDGCTDDGSDDVDSTTVGDDWEQVRSAFALDPDLAHFAAFVLAGHPAPVRDAIASWRERLDTDPDAVLHEATQHDDEVRAAAADYLGVQPQELALTDSTTMGLGLTYHGLRLQPADHILTSTHDFYSTHESLRLAADQAGAEVEQIALYDDPAAASADQIVSRVRAALRPETRVVALTWVHSSTGVKLPVPAIADAVAEANAARDADERVVFGLDAVHGFGAEAVGPNELGCDVFISGTHKWLFGPRGTGLVWLRPDVGGAVRPIIPGFDTTSMGNWFLDRHATGPYGPRLTPGGYQAFEHRWAVADAFGFHREIGRDQVAARTAELATQLKDGLAELSHLRIVTPRDPLLSSGIVCCEIGGIDPGGAILALRERYGIVASVTPYRESYVRFGPSIVTTPEQVDALVESVASL